MDITALETAATEMPASKVKELLIAYAEQTNDLKIIKDSIYTLMIKIGIVKEDGTFRENINMKVIMDVAMQATMNSKKFTQEMSFLKDLVPLVEKYKHL